MLATASKPRGDKSCVRETKLPAALLMSSVSGPSVKICSIISSTAMRIADVDAVAYDAPAVLAHQFGGGLVAHALAPAADVHLGAKLQKFGGHALAQASAAAGHENSPPGEKLIVEHRFHPTELSVNWSID